MNEIKAVKQALITNHWGKKTPKTKFPKLGKLPAERTTSQTMNPVANRCNAMEAGINGVLNFFA